MLEAPHLFAEDLTIAKPKGREVLVRVTAVGLCHSDMHVIDGGAPLPLPILLGHEVAALRKSPFIYSLRT